jgi:adenylate cyclase
MTTRRLAAILAADVVGFSSLMEKDEEGTLARIKTLQREVIEPKVRERGGRLVKTTGDGFLCEFGSPVEAVRCALDVQEATKASGGSELLLRMGINLGDIIVEPDGDIYGDGVNVAARLEQLAEPGGIYLSDDVHKHVLGKVDCAFEERGEQQVKNITRPFRVYALAGTAPKVKEPKSLPLPDKPSIAVLPFTNMSGDPEQEYFCDGLVEDIITALSRFKALFVIARNSSFTYKGRAVDVRQVGRELGVRYVLEGSVRKVGNRIRITGQLVEAETGAHVWADKYDGALEDIFDLQDSITAAVAGAIEPRLMSAEIHRAARKPPESFTAYDYYLRALPHAHLYNSREDIDEALRLLRAAIKADPNFSYAFAWIAWCYFCRMANGWAAVGETHDEGRQAAERSLRIDPDDPLVLCMASYVVAYLNSQHHRGLELAERALSLNPSSALAWGSKGWALNFQGRGDEAIACFEKAKRLSPVDSMSYLFDAGIGASHMHERRYAEAVIWLERARRETRDIGGLKRALAASYAHVGRLEDARAIAHEILAGAPDFSITKWRAQSPMRGRYLEELLDGLRKAGIPE